MDRRLLSAELLATGYGTHYYLAEWEGDFTDDELISAVDNHAFMLNPTEKDLTPRHYGGIVWHMKASIAGRNMAKVGVWYD